MVTQTDHESQVGVKEEYAYGFHDEDKAVFKTKRGLDHSIIDQISDQKHEPEWMRTFRHQALDIFFFAKAMPTWGADLSSIDFAEIFFYSRPSAKQGKNWEVVCDALLLDDASRSDIYPYIEVEEENISVGHEASVSKIGEEQLYT